MTATGPRTWCPHWNAARCRSCTLLPIPYAAQLADKDASVRARLGSPASTARWEDPASSPERGFRNKAKLVVGGRPGALTLGILDGHRHGVDLRDCGLYEPGLAAALPLVGDFCDDLGLVPYDLHRRKGELKYLLLTHSPTGDLMLRFVLRSPGALPRIERALPDLHGALPGLRVVSANLHPTHSATLEGETEIRLSHAQSLPMPVGDLTLHLQPRGFFQTNTAVAADLYGTASRWIRDTGPEMLWDLFCGVGGFGLTLAHSLRPPGAGAPRLVGVETSHEAIESAARTAADLGLDATSDFHADDALAFAREHLGGARGRVPDLVVVNPPRRGIGPDLADLLQASTVPRVLYSSCNVDTLAADLGRMPSLRPTVARLLDMFPHTEHHEVLVLLTRG